MTEDPEQPSTVIEHSCERVFDGFLKVDEAEVSFERYGGGLIERQKFLVLERGDSAAALVHDLTSNRLVLTEQFRYPTYGKGPGWLLETAAGGVKDGDDPAACMRREILEELGYKAKTLLPAGCVYPSPGGSSERIFLFYAPVAASDLVAPETTGVAEEREDIRRRVLKPSALYRLIDRGQVADAKLVLLAQWLRSRNGRLASRRGKQRLKKARARGRD